MILITVLLSSVSAAPPIKLAVVDLQAAGLSKEEAGFFTEALATRLNEFGVSAMTARSTGAVLALERSRQMMGCAESSCMAEIASALGADGVVTGDVARLGSSFTLSVRTLSARDGALLVAHEERAGSLEALTELVAPLARDLVVGVSRRLGREVPTAALRAPERPRPLRTAALVSGLLGLGVTGGGAGLLVASRELYGRIPQSADAPPQDAKVVARLAADGKALQAGGVAALAVGGAAVAAAVVLLIVDGASATAPVVALGPHGEAWVGIAGGFP